MENHEAGRPKEKQVLSQCNMEMTYGVFKITNYPVKSLFLFTCFSPIGLNRRDKKAQYSLSLRRQTGFNP